MGVMCCQTRSFFVPVVFKTTLDTTGCGDVFFSSFVYFLPSKKFNLKEISFLSHLAGLHGLDRNKNIVKKTIFFRQHNQF